MFHMMGAISELGRVGLTAVGDSPDQADATFRRAERLLLEEAQPPAEVDLPSIVQPDRGHHSLSA